MLALTSFTFILKKKKPYLHPTKPNNMTINPYLNFLGNTEEAFLFYKSVLGGELPKKDF